jgi:hypothetical protein
LPRILPQLVLNYCRSFFAANLAANWWKPCSAISLLDFIYKIRAPLYFSTESLCLFSMCCYVLWTSQLITTIPNNLLLQSLITRVVTDPAYY